MVSSDDDTPPKEDYRGAASALFGNVRIPSALFAGASAGATFALPLGTGETLKVALVKRLYVLLMMGALSSQIIAVVIATLTTGSLATRAPTFTSSLSELLEQEYSLEWISTRWHFVSGIVMFMVGLGLRGWITIGCPVIAKAALGIVLTSACLCVAFVQDLTDSELFENVWVMPVKYGRLFFGKAKAKPLFAIAFAMALLTNGYIIGKAPHIYQYLSKH